MVIIRCGGKNLYKYFELCEDREKIQEEVFINNAVGNLKNKESTYFTDIQIIFIVLLLGLIFCIGYRYLKTKFFSNISNEVNRQVSV